MVTNYKMYLSMWPAECEINAVKRVLEVIQRLGYGSMHFLGVSVRDTIDEISKTKAVTTGSCITSSVDAHHFFYSANDVDSKDTRFKCQPLIRDEKNQMALLTALAQDSIDLVTSSHFPTLTQLKEDCHDFLRALPGASTLG